jgi:hypothetical protein
MQHLVAMEFFARFQYCKKNYSLQTSEFANPSLHLVMVVVQPSEAYPLAVPHVLHALACFPRATLEREIEELHSNDMAIVELE